LHKTAIYNVTGVDHHWLVEADAHHLVPEEEAMITNESLNRLRSLLSVDDIVGEIAGYLEAEGELENTYIVFTSDHGYSLGQFCIPSHKNQVYDHVVRVPFVVSGPGIASSSQVSAVASFADIAPTLLELAGYRVAPGDGYTEHMDGRSFARLLHGRAAAGPEEPWKEAALIEYQSIYGGADGQGSRSWPSSGPLPGRSMRYTDSGNNTFVGLRIVNATHDMLYAEFARLEDWDFKDPYFRELYDHRLDPYQQNNIYSAVSPALKVELHERLRRAFLCKGGLCNLK